MLSLFPSLLSWNQTAPLLIRLCLGVIFLFWAYRLFRTGSASASMKLVGLVEAIAGVLMVIGLWTQLAALVAGIDLVVRIGGRIKARAFLTDGVNYYVVLLVLAISLMVLGAGKMAFDLPI